MSQRILPSIGPLSAEIASLSPALSRGEAESLVRRFGANSTSYVLLEGAKCYFTSRRVEGFIAYQLSTGVAVIGGDPVCHIDDAAALLSDFITQMDGKQVCAYQVSPEMLGAFRANGFGDVQIGKEAVFDLHRFTLAGGAMEIVRAATNKARREGVVVTEHDPFAPGAETINNEIAAVSEEWLRDKGNHEMGFLLGGLELGTESEKRYFIARSGNGAGRIEGFVVCEPIYARRGYYLDVTRRRCDAVRGSMELLTSEIFRQLKEEGYEHASMGLAPLADLDDPDLLKHPRLANVMRFLYERVEKTYDFRQLFRYKSKYHPQGWESRYLCFHPRISARILYATLRVRETFTLRDLITRRQQSATSTDKPRHAWASWKSWKHVMSLAIGFLTALFSVSRN